HEDIAFVGGMPVMLRDYGDPQSGKLRDRAPDALRMIQAGGMPLRHATQLHATYYGLHFKHAGVGSKAFVKPAVARRVIAFVDGCPALAVVLPGPHGRPERAIVRGDHAAFAAGGHDLVLAEGPGTNVADRADRAALVSSTVRLGAVFDDPEVMRR